jgi:hypothetical protein
MMGFLAAPYHESKTSVSLTTRRWALSWQASDCDWSHHIKGAIKQLQFEVIVSQDFSDLFFISFARYEVPNRARSGLIFIVMTFSNLNTGNKKIFDGKDPSE